MKRFGLRADKRLGQNFLEDPFALERIVQAAEIQAGETVLEIGAGLGSLTRYLAVRARRVVAVELDERLLPPLNAVLAPYPNVQVIHGDILELSPGALTAGSRYAVVANIPYYITSAIIRHLLDPSESPGSNQRPRRTVLTIQHEVAERICALPGDLSLLALSVQVYGEPRLVQRIPAGAFYPAPKVDSAILAIDTRATPLIPDDQLEFFFLAARAGFSQKRKTLRNSLSAGLRLSPAATEKALERAGIDPRRRAETLSIPEWVKIVAVTRPEADGDTIGLSQ